MSKLHEPIRKELDHSRLEDVAIFLVDDLLDGDGAARRPMKKGLTLNGVNSSGKRWKHEEEEEEPNGCSAWKIDRQQIYTSARPFVLNWRKVNELTDRSEQIKEEFDFP